MGLEGADPQRIFAIGASIGADGAVFGCLWLNENYPGSCQGAIAISPGSYLALPYDDVVSELTDLGDTPLLCYYGKEDTESADTCESATGDKIPFPGAGHGIELLPKLWIPDSNIQLFGEKATGMEILVDVIRFAFGVDE